MFYNNLIFIAEDVDKFDVPLTIQEPELDYLRECTISSTTCTDLYVF